MLPLSAWKTEGPRVVPFSFPRNRQRSGSFRGRQTGRKRSGGQDTTGPKRSGHPDPERRKNGRHLQNREILRTFGGVFGEMQEWLNWPAWKASKHQKCFRGSNPLLSAKWHEQKQNPANYIFAGFYTLRPTIVKRSKVHPIYECGHCSKTQTPTSHTVKPNLQVFSRIRETRHKTPARFSPNPETMKIRKIQPYHALHARAMSPDRFDPGRHEMQTAEKRSLNRHVGKRRRIKPTNERAGGRKELICKFLAILFLPIRIKNYTFGVLNERFHLPLAV